MTGLTLEFRSSRNFLPLFRPICILGLFPRSAESCPGCKRILVLELIPVGPCGSRRCQCVTGKHHSYQIMPSRQLWCAACHWNGYCLSAPCLEISSTTQSGIPNRRLKLGQAENRDVKYSAKRLRKFSFWTSWDTMSVVAVAIDVGDESKQVVYLELAMPGGGEELPSLCGPWS